MIKKYKIIFLFILFPFFSISQSFVPYNEIGVFMGGSYYIGDLNEVHFNLTNPATGIFYKKNIDRRFAIKSSLLYGEIRGIVSTDGAIQLAKNGKIFGDVKSSSIQMNGYIEGDMFIDGTAELLSNCELVGNLQYRVLNIQDGAQFSGRCEIINDEE